MEEELYDEFGNYIGPQIEVSDEGQSSDDSNQHDMDD
jgi:hypothetical protein